MKILYFKNYNINTHHKFSGENLNSRGFTLIETLIAIFIFSIAITALFVLSGTTTNSGQYSKNDIIGTYLAQEAIDIVRNDRDTIVFQRFNQGGVPDWSSFILKYDSCFNVGAGCEIDSLSRSVYPCSSVDDEGNNSCSKINVYRDESPTPDIDYYGIDQTGLIDSIQETSFRRKIVFYNNPSGGNSVIVVVTISWKNGTSTKTKIFTETLYDWYK